MDLQPAPPAQTNSDRQQQRPQLTPAAWQSDSQVFDVAATSLASELSEALADLHPLLAALSSNNSTPTVGGPPSAAAGGVGPVPRVIEALRTIDSVAAAGGGGGGVGPPMSPGNTATMTSFLRHPRFSAALDTLAEATLPCVDAVADALAANLPATEFAVAVSATMERVLHSALTEVHRIATTAKELNDVPPVATFTTASSRQSSSAAGASANVSTVPSFMSRQQSSALAASLLGVGSPRRQVSGVASTHGSSSQLQQQPPNTNSQRPTPLSGMSNPLYSSSNGMHHHNNNLPSPSVTTTGEEEGNVAAGSRPASAIVPELTVQGHPVPGSRGGWWPQRQPSASSMSDVAFPRSITTDSIAESTRSLHQLHRAAVIATTRAQCIQDSAGYDTLNQYLALQELGRGAQGRVFLALDTEANALRAVKELPRPAPPPPPAAPVSSTSQATSPLLAASMMGARSPQQEQARAKRRAERHRAALMREVAIMKRLRHRHIVSLYEVIDDPSHDRLYMVMQYVDRGAIAKAVDFHWTCVDPVKLLDYARQLAAGLVYLHNKGIAHRDIKPDNLLRDEQGNAFLADFGVSALCGPPEERGAFSDASSLTRQTTEDTFGASLRQHSGGGPQHWDQRQVSTASISSMGLRTPSELQQGAGGALPGALAFAAPEQIRPPPPSATTTSATPPPRTVQAADVWALGMSFYAMLFGRLPYDVRDPLRYMESVCGDYDDEIAIPAHAAEDEEDDDSDADEDTMGHDGGDDEPRQRRKTAAFMSATPSSASAVASSATTTVTAAGPANMQHEGPPPRPCHADPADVDNEHSGTPALPPKASCGAASPTDDDPHSPASPCDTNDTQQHRQGSAMLSRHGTTTLLGGGSDIFGEVGEDDGNPYADDRHDDDEAPESPPPAWLSTVKPSTAAADVPTHNSQSVTMSMMNFSATQTPDALSLVPPSGGCDNSMSPRHLHGSSTASSHQPLELSHSNVGYIPAAAAAAGDRRGTPPTTTPKAATATTPPPPQSRDDSSHGTPRSMQLGHDVTTTSFATVDRQGSSSQNGGAITPPPTLGAVSATGGGGPSSRLPSVLVEMSSADMAGVATMTTMSSVGFEDATPPPSSALQPKSKQDKSKTKQPTKKAAVMAHWRDILRLCFERDPAHRCTSARLHRVIRAAHRDVDRAWNGSDDCRTASSTPSHLGQPDRSTRRPSAAPADAGDVVRPPTPPPQADVDNAFTIRRRQPLSRASSAAAAAAPSSSMAPSGLASERSSGEFGGASSDAFFTLPWRRSAEVIGSLPSAAAPAAFVAPPELVPMPQHAEHEDGLPPRQQPAASEAAP